MSDLPSRKELAVSDKEVWTHALEIASQHAAMDLTTASVLNHIRHLIVTGHLVDREAIDYERIEEILDELCRDWYAMVIREGKTFDFGAAIRALDAALGEV